ncbi:hypothetical protein FRC20_010574 [Serendipita sp. 405]|nr:hypothetical protein FRC20_010574 [Serendipita sp. 405]
MVICVHATLLSPSIKGSFLRLARSVMTISLSHDIFVSIIQDYTSERSTLCSLSLVSRSFCDAAQRILFDSVLLYYDPYSTEEDSQKDIDHPDPFEWPKLEFLARSNKILQYIQVLGVVISYAPNRATCDSDTYWQETGGRPVLDTLDRFLPSCLDRMSALSEISYSGPALRTPMHQAILCHKTLQFLKVSAKTHCSVPCKEALQQAKSGSVRKLDFIELGNELGVFGIVGPGLYSAGPRRCAFLSHMILTHSTSLRVLKVPITLLYDALRPHFLLACKFPDFPRLSSLHIEDSKTSFALRRLFPAMTATVVSFILHVHQTLEVLHWGLDMLEVMTKRITTAHLPNLTKLSGYRIQHLIQSQLESLKIAGLLPSDFDLEKDWSLLRQTSSILPGLTILALSTTIQLMAIPRDICTFKNLVDLWYEELPDCTLYHGESQGDFVFEFLHVVLPALSKLRDLCITVNGTTLDYGAIAMPATRLLPSSRSLLRLTIQYVVLPMTCYRLDVNRNDPKSSWMHASYEGLHYQKKFTLDPS